MIECRALMFLLLLFVVENAFAYKPMQINFNGKILDIETYDKHRIITVKPSNHIKIKLRYTEHEYKLQVNDVVRGKCWTKKENIYKICILRKIKYD